MRGCPGGMIHAVRLGPGPDLMGDLPRSRWRRACREALTLRQPRWTPSPMSAGWCPITRISLDHKGEIKWSTRHGRGMQEVPDSWPKLLQARAAGPEAAGFAAQSECCPKPSPNLPARAASCTVPPYRSSGRAGSRRDNQPGLAMLGPRRAVHGVVPASKLACPMAAHGHLRRPARTCCSAGKPPASALQPRVLRAATAVQAQRFPVR